MADITADILKTISNQVSYGSRKIEVTLDNTFDDLGLDSLDQLELIMELEDVFGVQISDTYLENVVDVRQLVAVVQGVVDEHVGRMK